jgi:Helix-turn-helix domain
MSPVIRRSLQGLESPKPVSTYEKSGYNVGEAATYAGTSVWQIRQWIASGELKPAVIGNKHILDKAALDRLLDGLFRAA